MLQRLQLLQLRGALHSQLFGRCANYTQQPLSVRGSGCNKDAYRESRLFVSNLPQNVTWKELKDYFAPSGAKYVSISEDPKTGKSKGCGVIQYDSLDEATNAVKRLNGSFLRGSSLKVRFDRKTSDEIKPAVKNLLSEEASVGGIKAKYTSKPDTTNESLRRLIRQRGQGEAAAHAQVVTRSDGEINSYFSREMATKAPMDVELSEETLPRMAALADIDRLLDWKPQQEPVVYHRDKSDNLPLSPMDRAAIEDLVRRRAEVREKGDFRQSDVLRAQLRETYGVDCHDIQRTWTVCPKKVAAVQEVAAQKSTKEADGMASTANNRATASDARNRVPGVRLFVSNIPLSSSWQDLKDHFEKLGPKFARIQTDPATGKSTGCGLVQFESMQEASRALKALDGSSMQGSVLNVRFDVLDEFGAESARKGDASTGSAASKVAAVEASENNALLEPAVDAPVYQRSVDDVLYVSKSHQQAITELVRQRAVAAALGRVDAAQDAEDELLYAYDVRCNDEERTWSVVKPASTAGVARKMPVSSGAAPSLAAETPRFVEAARDARSFARSERAASGSPAVHPATPSRLFVSNVPYEVTWNELKAHFADTGCSFVKIHYDEEKGGSKGTAVVEYNTAESAARAIAVMDKSELRGLTLNVRADLEADKRPPREPREARGKAVEAQAVAKKTTEEDARLERARAGVEHLLAMQRLQEVLIKEKQRRATASGPELKVFTHAQELEKVLAARREKKMVDTDSAAPPVSAGRSIAAPFAQAAESSGDAPQYRRATQDINYVPRAELAEITQLVQQRAELLRQGDTHAAKEMSQKLLANHSVACSDDEGTWEVVTAVLTSGKKGGGARNKPAPSVPPKPVRSEVGAADFDDTPHPKRFPREDPGSAADPASALYKRAAHDINYVPRAELAEITRLVQQRALRLREDQSVAVQELSQELLSTHNVSCNDRDGTWELVTVVSRPSRKRGSGR